MLSGDDPLKAGTMCQDTVLVYDPVNKCSDSV